MAAATEGELDAAMDQSLAMRARAGTYFVEERDRPFFKKARANAAEHIVRRVALQNDVVDPVGVKQLPQEQSRRPRANDCYFCPQRLLPRLLWA